MITTFADAPPLVYTEAQWSGDTIDDPSLVKKCRKAYDRLRAAALPPKAPLAMIEAAAEYRNGISARLTRTPRGGVRAATTAAAIA